MLINDFKYELRIESNVINVWFVIMICIFGYCLSDFFCIL